MSECCAVLRFQRKLCDMLQNFKNSRATGKKTNIACLAVLPSVKGHTGILVGGVYKSQT